MMMDTIETKVSFLLGVLVLSLYFLSFFFTSAVFCDTNLHRIMTR